MFVDQAGWTVCESLQTMCRSVIDSLTPLVNSMATYTNANSASYSTPELEPSDVSVGQQCWWGRVTDQCVRPVDPDFEC